MPKTIKSIVQDAQARPLPYVVQVVGLLVILVNLWLGSKLYPLVKAIDEVKADVALIDSRHVTELKNINERLERIEDKLDRHLER